MLGALIKKPWVRATVLSSMSFLTFGGWGVHVNLRHGLAPSVRAGVAQGLLSGGMTLMATALVELLFRVSERPLLRFSVAVGGTAAILGTIGVVMHYVAGTPEIVRTMLPPFGLGLAYIVIYARFLLRGVEPPL